MAVKNTGLTTKGIRSEFFEKHDARSAASLYVDAATRIASTTDSENYRFLGQAPSMRAWGTGRQVNELVSESYRIENETYESTIEVDRNELDDDQTGQIRMRVEEMADKAATHKDFLLAGLMVNGATSGNVSYDGVTYFNASHASGASGNQSNLVGVATDAGAAGVPTVAQFKTAFTAAYAAMAAFKDDTGAPLFLDSSGLTVVVPGSLEFVAREALNATLISNTSNVIAGMAGVKMSPFLPNATTALIKKCYLVKTNVACRPFIFQDRMPIEFAAIDAMDAEHVFKTGKLLFGVRARYRLAYGRWQYCIEITFTSPP